MEMLDKLQEKKSLVPTGAEIENFMFKREKQKKRECPLSKLKR